VLARAAFYLANRDYLLRRVAAMWSQYNDQGAMHVLAVTEGRVELDVTGVSPVNPMFCRVLTGWVYAVGCALGGSGKSGRHLSCIARGGDSCRWEFLRASDKVKTRPEVSARR
jgi:hypothetical protein